MSRSGTYYSQFYAIRSMRQWQPNRPEPRWLLDDFVCEFSYLFVSLRTYQRQPSFYRASVYLNN